MAYDGRYDNPAFINAFLQSLKFTDEELADRNNDGTTEIATEVKTEVADSAPGSMPQSGVNTPAIISSAAGSPANGTRAPPSTPEHHIPKVANLVPLPPIDEDQNEGRKYVTRAERYQSSLQQFRPTAAPFQPSSPVPSIGQVITRNEQNNLGVSFANDLKNDARVQNYSQDALTKHKEQAAARLAQTVDNADANQPPTASPSPDDKTSQSVDIGKDATNKQDDANRITLADNGKKHNIASSNAEHSRDVQDESTAISEGSDGYESSINIIVDAPKSPKSFNSEKSVTAITIAALKNGATGTPVDEIAHNLENGTKINNGVMEEEPRDHAIYFPTWGTPSQRSTGPARVRMVKLENLPVIADFTLVQSLIYGGAIEEMKLLQATNGSTTAFVTFTDAEACDRYYNAYPNGLEFKHNGKKQIAYVNKDQDVNVVSSVLQSYLDCGASRVVKVMGADEEWSMKALFKIAEGRNARRKVEAIVDNYRIESRTIIFRFTKIADAVTFRGELLRSSDWMDTDVQFMVDPCEKAAGIHYE